MDSRRSRRRRVTHAAGVLGSFAWDTVVFASTLLLLAVLLPTLLLDMSPSVITSGSMGPRISRGDVVLIGDPGPGPVRAGRIITFEHPDAPGGAVTHRVTGRDEQGRYLTRGDANPADDGVPIPASQVLGVGRLVVPLIGLPVLWLRDGDVLAMLAAGAYLAMLLASYLPAGVRRRALRHPGVFSVPFPSAAGGPAASPGPSRPAPSPVNQAERPAARPSPTRRPARQLQPFCVATPASGGWASFDHPPVVSAAGAGRRNPHRVPAWLALGALVVGMLGPVLLAGAAEAAFNATTSAGATLQAADRFGFTHDQHVGSAACGGPTSQVIVPEDGVAEGSTVIVRVVIRQGSDSGAISAVDSRANTYQVDVDAVRPGQVRTAILSAHVGTALAQGDTISVTHPDGAAEAVVIEQFSGILAADRIDATAATHGNNAAPSASVTTVTDPALVLGAVGTHGDFSYTEHTGWTSLSTLKTSGCGVVDSHAAYRIAEPGAVAYSPTLTGNDDWAEALIAYRFQVDTTPPATPVLSGSAGDEQAALSWTTVTDPSAPVSYRLTRDGVEVYEGTDTSFTDTGLANGSSYGYAVTASDAPGNVSPPSSGLTLVPTPVSFVHEFGQTTCAVSGTSTVTVPAGGVAAGNTLLVRVVLRQPSSDVAPVAVSDGLHDYGTADADIAEPADVRTVVFSAAITQGLPAGATITVTHPAAAGVVVVADEFTGLGEGGAVEAVDTRVGSDALGLSSQVTAVSTLGLVYGVVGIKDFKTYTEDAAGWQSLSTVVDNPCTAGAPLSYGAYRLLSTPGTHTHNPTLDANKQWARALLVYRSEVDVTPPPVPTLSGTPGNGQNTLDWTAVTDPSSPVTYQLLRDGVEVYDGTATTFTDTGLSNGNTYSYVVHARDALGYTSAASNTVTLRPTPIAFVQAVGSVVCGGTTSVVTVPAGGVAAGNTVLVRVVIREGDEIAPISAVDSAGNTYTVDGEAIRPTKIRTVVLSAHIDTPLAAGSTITVTHPAGKAQVVAVEEFTGIADAARVDVVGTGSGNTANPTAAVTTTSNITLVYATVGTRASRTHAAPSGWTALAGVVSPSCAGGTADSHAGHRAEDVTGTYTYSPTLGGGSDEWAAIAVAYRSAVDTTAPATPTLTGSAGNGEVTLDWTVVTDPSPPVTYQLYRAGDLVYDGTATTFTDAGLTNGVTVTYTVRATDGRGNQSGASNAVNVTPSSIEHLGAVGSITCVGAGSTGSVTSTITVPAGGVAQGGTLVVRVLVRKGSPEAGAVSATDDRGNSYTLDVDALFAGHTRTAVLSAHVDTALSGGDQIMVTHPAGEATAVQADAFSGIAAAGRVDGTGTGSGNNTVPSASATTVQATAVLIGALATEGVPSSHTDSAGWTPLADQQVTCSGKELGAYSAHRAVSSAGAHTYAPVLGTARNHSEVVVAYRSETDLTAPAEPVLSGVPGDGRNDLSWSASADPSAPVQYRLYRDGYLIHQGQTTTFADTGRTNGTAHTYVVRAADAADNVSGDSNALVLRATPIAFIQQVGAASCAGTTSAIAVPAGGVPAGHTLLIRVALQEPSPEGGAVTASDTQGNTYTADADAVRPGKVRTVVLSGYVSNALAGGDTITVTHPDGKAEAVVVDEFTGIRATQRLHTSGTGSGNTAAPAATLSTASGSLLLYGAVATRATRSHVAPGSWSALSGVTSGDCGGGSRTDSNAARRLVSTTGTWTYDPTLTGGSDEWAAVVVAYAPITGNDQVPPPQPLMGEGGGGGEFLSFAQVTTPPPAPGTVELTWTAVDDPSSPVTYQLLRDGTEIVSTTATSHTDAGLVEGVEYTYVVRATDAAGNQSSDSNAVRLTPGADVDPPLAPELTGTAGDGQVALSWTPVEDPSSPVMYELLRDGFVIVQSAATEYIDTGLTNDVPSTYVVRATDAAGNVSPDSNTVAVTPAADPEAPATEEPAALEADALTADPTEEITVDAVDTAAPEGETSAPGQVDDGAAEADVPSAPPEPVVAEPQPLQPPPSEPATPDPAPVGPATAEPQPTAVETTAPEPAPSDATTPSPPPDGANTPATPTPIPQVEVATAGRRRHRRRAGLRRSRTPAGG